MIKPLVSIIIPTYNRAHLIGETLDSIIAQTYTNWECIVIDDGSTDATAELLEDYCKNDVRFQYHQRPTYRPKGANSCRNYGFELSKGEFINWFDSDDLLVNDAFVNFINEFEINIDVVVSKVQKFKSLSELLNQSVIFSKNIIDDYLEGKITFYPSGVVWNREFLVKQEQLFDTSISNLDDWDFHLRMLYRKPVIKYINTPLIYYRVHDNSLSHEIGKLNFNEIKSEFKAREKHVNLLRINKLAPPNVLKKFIKERYKYLLRVALLQQSNLKYYLLKKTIIKQVALLNFLGCFKTLVGFVTYSMFKKGYRFIK
jgi:glycosyltransferase involved in cell wall biosynthesis